MTSQLTWTGQFIIIILFILCLIFYRELIENDKMRILTHLLFYYIMIIPIIIYLGAYRLNDYFMLGRVILWGNIIHIIKYKFISGAKMRFLYNIGVSFVVVLYLSFRIYRMLGAGIMPYKFDY